MEVGPTLGQRRDDSADVGPTVGQPTLLPGSGRIGQFDRCLMIGGNVSEIITFWIKEIGNKPPFHHSNDPVHLCTYIQILTR